MVILIAIEGLDNYVLVENAVGDHPASLDAWRWGLSAVKHVDQEHDRPFCRRESLTANHVHKLFAVLVTGTEDVVQHFAIGGLSMSCHVLEVLKSLAHFPFKEHSLQRVRRHSLTFSNVWAMAPPRFFEERSFFSGVWWKAAFPGFSQVDT